MSHSNQKADYASSTYSTSTTATEKPLLASSEKKSSNPWQRAKKALSQPVESIDAAYERKARERAAQGKEPARRMPAFQVPGLGPYNDRKPFSGRF
jgi:hypothetical protein